MDLDSSPSLLPRNPSSPSAVSCHIFFNSTQDHMGYYNHDQIYLPHQVSGDYPPGYNHGYKIKNQAVDQSRQQKLTLWKKEDGEGHDRKNSNNNHYPVKWTSSKMRLMQKMKSRPSRITLKITAPDDFSGNTNNNIQRVCSDCNTTKTPLWRSGPKGPKSLCNACGIRQRKARRAMAAAAANGMPVSSSTYIQPSAATAKLKVQQKGKNGHLKKRCKSRINGGSSSSSNGQKRNGFEDLLVSLSKNLSFHRVFPEEEKDAALLLMALSSGLAHG